MPLEEAKSTGDLVFGVPHIKQREHWDCGISCCLMLCKHFAINCTYETLTRLIGTQSVWTIDLAYLLYKVGVQARLYTVTVGVDPSYKDKSFYRNELSEDELRVNRLFYEASKHDITVSKRSLSNKEFDSLLSERAIIIVLVDKRQLKCEQCSTLEKRIWGALKSEFIGHFVLVVGYTPEGLYAVLDPDESHGCVVTPTVLHKARCTHGTDEDLLVISRQAQISALHPQGDAAKRRVANIINERGELAGEEFGKTNELFIQDSRLKDIQKKAEYAKNELLTSVASWPADSELDLANLEELVTKHMTPPGSPFVGDTGVRCGDHDLTPEFSISRN